MMRKAKEGDEKSGKKTGLLNKTRKLPLSKKAATEKKEESEDVKPKTRTLSTPSPTLKRSSKDASKVASRTASDTVESPTKTAASKTGSQKKLKPGEKLERTSAPVSRVKTSSATSTSPTSAKKTPKSKAKSTESISPVHSKSTVTPKSETGSRKSSSEASVKKESRSSSTTPTKARVTPISSKKKAVGAAAKHTKTKSMSSTETPKENKISGRIMKTISGIGQRLKSTTPRDKKTPREKKERKKSLGSSSFRSALESLDEQTTEKLMKTSPTPSGKLLESTTSEISSPTSQATSTKSSSKKHKESISSTLSPETELMESVPDLTVDVQAVEEMPALKPETAELIVENKGPELTEPVHLKEISVSQKEQSEKIGGDADKQVVLEEVKDADLAEEKPKVDEGGKDILKEPEVKDERLVDEKPKRDDEEAAQALVVQEERREVVEEAVHEDDERTGTEEFFSLSAGSSHWSLLPNTPVTPVARTAHDFLPPTSVRSQSLTSRDAGSGTGTTSRDMSPELLHHESGHMSQGLPHEEPPIVEETKAEIPPATSQPSAEGPAASEDSSVGAEVGSDGSKPEDSSAVKTKPGLQKSSAESSVEAEVGSDDVKIESPSLVVESDVKTEQNVVTKTDLESDEKQTGRSLEQSVQMIGKLVASEETAVDKTPTKVVAMDVPSTVEEQHALVTESKAEASLEDVTAEGGLSMNKDGSLKTSEAVAVAETAQVKIEPVVISPAVQMNEAQDTVPTPELMTSSSQTDRANEDVLDESGSDSMVAYHSDGENPVEERREVKERLADLEDFGLPAEPAQEEKSETDLEEEMSRGESEHESPSFSTSEWSSDAAFASEPVEIDDPDLPADPAHSDEDLQPKSKTESQPVKQTAQTQVQHKGVPEKKQKERSLDLQDYIRPDTYTKHLVDDPVDTELQAGTVQSRSYIPSPPHEDDPEEDSRSKRRKGRGFFMSALCVLGGLGGIAVTVFLLHKRAG